MLFTKRCHEGNEKLQNRLYVLYVSQGLKSSIHKKLLQIKRKITPRKMIEKTLKEHDKGIHKWLGRGSETGLQISQKKIFFLPYPINDGGTIGYTYKKKIRVRPESHTEAPKSNLVKGINCEKQTLNF